jgi:integrase
MNASLQKKGNIYYAVVSLPDGVGKYKTKWITTRCSKKTDAAKEMREILDRMERGQQVGKCRYTFLEFLQYWLTEIIKPQIEQTTYEGYIDNLKNHIEPFFAALNLSLMDVQLIHLQKFITDKHKNGRLDGKGGLSGKSIRKYMANISKALDYAVKTGLIRHNPARYVEFPKDKTFTGAFYSVKEIEQLLKACRRTVLEPPIILATHYGLRRGEIMGLRWKDVDFAAGTMAICNTRVRIKTEVEKQPKSTSSLRTFPLIPSVKTYLAKLKILQEEHKTTFGNTYTDNDFVCKWPDGKALEIGYINSALTKLLKSNNMRHIRLHDLRHSTASYLNKLGFTPKEIQVWLGHSDIKTTMNIYTHIDVGMKENIASKISSLFGDF